MLWVNIIRAIVAGMCCVSIFIMSQDFYRHRAEWNVKTRDYWYSYLMWSIVGLSGSIEGIIRNVSFRYSLILLVAASLTTLKGLLRRGRWGGVRE